jgi:hypothetical protein
MKPKELARIFLCMNPRRITQQILQYKPQGKRDIGRPKRLLEDDLEAEQVMMDYLEVHGGDCYDAYRPNGWESQGRPLRRRNNF